VTKETLMRAASGYIAADMAIALAARDMIFVD
jgi:hypothetical protein